MKHNRAHTHIPYVEFSISSAAHIEVRAVTTFTCDLNDVCYGNKFTFIGENRIFTHTSTFSVVQKLHMKKAPPAPKRRTISINVVWIQKTVPCGLRELCLVYRESYESTHRSFAAALSDLSIWTNINHLKPYISCTEFVCFVPSALYFVGMCVTFLFCFTIVAYPTMEHVRNNIFCDFATQHCYVMRMVEV